MPDVEQCLDDVARGEQPVIEIVLIQDFAQPDGDGIEVAPGQAAVGREALGQNQNIAFSLREFGIVGAEEAADIRKCVLLGRHRAAVGIAEHLAGNIDRSRCLRSPLRVA